MAAAAVAAIAVMAAAAHRQRERFVQMAAGQARVKTPSSRPFGVCFSRTGKYLFVAGASLWIYGMSTAQPKLLTAIAIVRAAGMAVSPDGKYLAIAHPGDKDGSFGGGVGLYSVSNMLNKRNGLVAMRTTNASQADTSFTMTVQVGFSLDGKYLVACDEEKDRVTVLNVQALVAKDMTGAYRGSFTSGFVHPTALEFTKFTSGTQAVIFGSQNERGKPGNCRPGYNKGTLRLADLDKMKLVKMIPVGCTLSRISKRGGTVLACLRDEASVAAVSMADNRIVARIPVGIKPVGIKHALGGRVAVVACSNRDTPDPGDIRIIDAVRNTPLLTLAAGKFPRDVAVSPDGKTAVVTEFMSGSFQVLHLPKILAAAGKTL